MPHAEAEKHHLLALIDGLHGHLVEATSRATNWEVIQTSTMPFLVQGTSLVKLVTPVNVTWKPKNITFPKESPLIFRSASLDSICSTLNYIGDSLFHYWNPGIIQNYQVHLFDSHHLPTFPSLTSPLWSWAKKCSCSSTTNDPWNFGPGWMIFGSRDPLKIHHHLPACFYRISKNSKYSQMVVAW